jgi:hypothetical protein
VKVYDVRRTDGCQVMAKAHMAFGQVSEWCSMWHFSFIKEI